MKTTYETGVQGEEAAEEYLCREYGMRCLERRFRAKCGEIDLILLDGITVVFAEVKTRRTGEAGSGLAAVNKAKQKRILNASLIYLMRMRWMNRPVRFDLVEVHGGEMIYIPNAFQPYGSFYH